MKFERHADGLWHARDEACELTMCGRRRERQQRGRPAVKPSCPRCAAATAGTRPAPASTRTEPPQRRDGVCALPGCGKRRKRPAKSHPSALEAWDRDPFCSTECAKRWYGVSFRPQAEAA